MYLVKVFSARAAREWNSIPSNITNLNTYASFKFQLKKWLIESVLSTLILKVKLYCFPVLSVLLVEHLRLCT